MVTKKTSSMQYLIGINSLVMVLLGCTSLPFPHHYRDGTGESIIYNQSGHDITIKGHSRDYSRGDGLFHDVLSLNVIKNNGEKRRVFEKYMTSEKATQNAFFGVTYFVMGSDFVRIIFDCMGKAKCLKYIRNSECNEVRSPYCIDEYAVTRLGDRSFRYEYTFTEDDYNRAKPCPCDDDEKEEENE